MTARATSLRRDDGSGNIYEFTPDGTRSTFASGLNGLPDWPLTARATSLRQTLAAVTSTNLLPMAPGAPSLPDYAAKYIGGIGFHWYSESQFDNLKMVAEAFPGKALMLTEGANGDFSSQHANDWNLGENYGLNMIHDFNNGAVAWTDWNILLDENGGPNHVGNFSFAPVHANTKEGTVEYYNSYYYIGHFSKFIRPGAKRIISSSNWRTIAHNSFYKPRWKNCCNCNESIRGKVHL